MQIEFYLDQELGSLDPVLKSIGFGMPFKFTTSTGVASKELYIKVKPVNFLCNSNLLSDVFARGDCVICKLSTGSIAVAQGTRFVKLVNATIQVQE